jgi:hypothetical protein
MERVPTHGVDGWELVAYDRDRNDGAAVLVYERGSSCVHVMHWFTSGKREVVPRLWTMKRKPGPHRALTWGSA